MLPVEAVVLALGLSVSFSTVGIPFTPPQKISVSSKTTCSPSNIVSSGRPMVFC